MYCVCLSGYLACHQSGLVWYVYVYVRRGEGEKVSEVGLGWM